MDLIYITREELALANPASPKSKMTSYSLAPQTASMGTLVGSAGKR